jgi:hypothetical protein
MVCEFDVLEGTSQKDRVKQKYEALEHKYNDLDALIAELRHSDEELALSLLVRLRAGEHVQDILQSVSPGSISDDLDFDPSISLTSGIMSNSIPTSQALFAPSNQSPPFGGLPLTHNFPPPLAYPGEPLAHQDPMLGTGSIHSFQGNRGMSDPIDSKQVIAAISQSSPSSVGISSVRSYLLQSVAWQRGYADTMNTERLPVNWHSWGKAVYEN